MTTETVEKTKQEQIGERFRGKREEMNLSLKEAENATSIRMNYLQAIESGDVQKLISPVYAQGFVRQYATFLGIDGEQIVRENPEFFSKVSDQEFHYGIGTLEMRSPPSGGVKWLPNFVWVAGFVGVLFLAWYFARFLEVI